MKHFFLSLSVVAIAGLASRESYALPSFSHLSDVIDEDTDVPRNKIPLEKAVGVLFKDKTTNIFADFTLFPINPKNPSGYNGIGANLSRNSIIGFAGQHDMVADFVGEHTVLFRHFPDMQRLLALILAEQKRIDAEYPFDEKATIAAVKAFYAERYGWNPAPKTVAEKDQSSKGAGDLLRLSDFPPTLRHQLEGAYINEVRATTDEASPRQFDISNWKQARVRMERRDEKSIIVGQVPNNTYCIRLYLTENMTNFTIVTVGAPHLQKQAWSGHSSFDARVILTDAPGNVAPTPPQALPALEGDKPEEHEVTPPSSDVPSSLDLDAETALQKQVSFDAVRVPLQKFVADLSKQGGVPLTLSPELAKGKTLVARSAGMPMAEAMKSLARLYLGHWTKEGQKYTLSPDSLDELHLLMAQLGNNAYYGYRAPIFEPEGRDGIGAALADEVYGEADDAELKSKGGVAFTSLSDDLQQRLVQLYRDDHAGKLIIMQQRLIDARAQDIRLRFGPLPAGEIPRFFGGAYTQGAFFGTLGRDHTGLAAYTPDGRFVAQLLEGLEVRPASSYEREAEERTKAIDLDWKARFGNIPQPGRKP